MNITQNVVFEHFCSNYWNSKNENVLEMKTTSKIKYPLWVDAAGLLAWSLHPEVDTEVFREFYR